eukprot:c5965_g1_i1.p1 GENE.c5965_g1_i1~~c5965_g1_i1.p1  ORF type:complete len:200 (-),score=41.07 c5965_g1_i1:9-608(-)
MRRLSVKRSRSALHKSMRGGDCDASVYWLARMLEGGEDPRYIARRLIRFASEDVGLAEPFALVQAVATAQACQLIGMPECSVNLAQCVVYLARAPKSVAVYNAYKSAHKCVMSCLNEPVPLHICNAPTQLMKDIGYAQNYQYNPELGYVRGCDKGYLPDSIKEKRFFHEDDIESGWKLQFGGKPSDLDGGVSDDCSQEK